MSMKATVARFDRKQNRFDGDMTLRAKTGLLVTILEGDGTDRDAFPALGSAASVDSCVGGEVERVEADLKDLVL